MNYTLSTVAKSLADYLAPLLPGVTMYEDPNQQDSAAPCMFLQQRYSYIEKRQAGRWLRRTGLDLTYLEDYNLPDLQQKYLAAAEALDLAMETFPYSDGESEGTTLLRTYNREWNIDLDALHYKFELQSFVLLPESYPKMQALDIDERIKE